MAESEGFEPSVQALGSYNGLANRRLRPLGQLSARTIQTGLRGLTSPSPYTSIKLSGGRRSSSRLSSLGGFSSTFRPRSARTRFESLSLHLYQTFWRKERDSNPRTACTVTGFQDRRHQPLGHPSAMF